MEVRYEAGTWDTPLQLRIIATLQLQAAAGSPDKVSISRCSVSPPSTHLCQMNRSCVGFLACLKSARPEVTCCLSPLRCTGCFRIKWVWKKSSEAKLKVSRLGVQLCGIRGWQHPQPAELEAQGDRLSKHRLAEVAMNQNPKGLRLIRLFTESE